MNLLICELISAACLIVLGIQLVIFVLKALLKGRAQRIAYIRNFKRGRCVIVYFTALPLYFIGYLYSGTGIIESFFSSIHRIINLIVLKYEFTAVAQLMADSSIFSFTIYVNFILVGVNAVMFALSLFGQHVSYAIGLVLLNLGKKQRLYIFGINDQNKLIYNSYKNGAKCLIGYADDKQQTAFYVEKIKYVQVSPGQNYTDDVVAKCKRGEVYAVINTQSDDENIKLCRKFILELNKLVKKEQNSAGLLKKFHNY